MYVVRSTLLLLALFAAEGPVSIPAGWSEAERTAAAVVQDRLLRSHIRFLADDLLEGRGAGSRGGVLAMKYIAAAYERLGLEPAAEGSYFQRVEMVGLKTELAEAPTFRAGSAAPLTLASPKDAVVSAGGQSEHARLDSREVVFVGYGIVAPEQQWNDFKDVDVRGKVLLVMNNDPENDPSLFAGKTRLYYGRWTYKYEEAIRKGAAGAIILHTTPSAGYSWQVVQSTFAGEQFALPAPKGEPHLAVKMWVTEEAGRKIAALGGHDLDELRRRAERRDFRPVPLGVTLSTSLRTKIRTVHTANVLGRLRGRDARLSQEAVVVSAHHDHLGIGEPKNGDAIYNGALDNASGVAAMLAIAQGLTRPGVRPQRSILFAAMAAEESGLLGSEYFAKHPTLPAGRIAANINIDGLNIWGRTRDVTFVGLGKSSLDEVVRAVAREQGRTVVPDQFPDRGYFYRSDQFNFARIGVPAIFLDTGTDFLGHDRSWGRERVEEYERRHYHQPSDELTPEWNLEGAVDDLRLLLVVARRVAEADSLPAWNTGDEFEAARKRALAATGR
jgi:Zn-dependent M28 family amino/carboxypeptidase